MSKLVKQETSRRKRRRPLHFDTYDSDSYDESDVEIIRLARASEVLPDLQDSKANLKKRISGSFVKSELEIFNGPPQSCCQIMANEVYKYIEQIHGELKELNQKYSNVCHQLEKITANTSGNLTSTCNKPTDLNLPIESDEMLLKLNERLKNDPEVATLLVHYLHACGFGKSPRSFMLSILRKLLSPDLAVTYSRFGRKGKKSFSHFAETLNVILDAASLKYPECSREEYNDILGKCLACAADWNKRRQRQSEMSTFSVADIYAAEESDYEIKEEHCY